MSISGRVSRNRYSAQAVQLHTAATENPFRTMGSTRKSKENHPNLDRDICPTLAS